MQERMYSFKLSDVCGKEAIVEIRVAVADDVEEVLRASAETDARLVEFYDKHGEPPIDIDSSIAVRAAVEAVDILKLRFLTGKER